MGGDDEPAGPQLAQAGEDSIEVTFGAGVEDMKLEPECASRGHCAAALAFRKWGIGRVDEERNDARRGDQLMQQFEPLRRYLQT